VRTTTTVPGAVTRKRNVLTALNGPSKILIRVDFNVPMDGDVTMTDDGTIKGEMPTIRAVLQAGHMPILCSHMGRPELVQKGPVDDTAVIPSSL
jgi:3-phosphoglycerate kinase